MCGALPIHSFSWWVCSGEVIFVCGPTLLGSNFHPKTGADRYWYVGHHSSSLTTLSSVAACPWIHDGLDQRVMVRQHRRHPNLLPTILLLQLNQSITMGPSLTVEEQYESIPFPEIPQALTVAVLLAGSATSWRRMCFTLLFWPCSWPSCKPVIAMTGLR
jgi:hypothetical protein